MQIVLIAPRVGELVVFPSFVYREEHQMISLRLVKFGSLLVGLGSLVLRAIKERLHREHRNDRQHFLSTRKIHRRQQNLGQVGV
jgi:hypothetical protein